MGGNDYRLPFGALQAATVVSFIRASAQPDRVAWFDFPALCETPRSAVDYIEIARRFHTVLVSKVPRLDDEKRDSALRFVHLVDALYEHNVNLLVSADAAPGELYSGTRMEVKFARAASRLREMQTRKYLAREHGP